MSITLMPSQKLIYEKIKINEEKYFRRKNTLLFGKQQTGKTILAKYIAEHENKYVYVNFTKEHLEKFITGKRLSSLTFNDFLDYIRIVFKPAKYNEKIIILDELDSIISVIGSNDQYRLIMFYSQLLNIDYPIQFIFVTPIFNDSIYDNLAKNFNEKIYFLDFNREDKYHIIKHIHNNINLFDVDKIINLRQLLNP